VWYLYWDYFRSDAYKYAINIHCYWCMPNRKKISGIYAGLYLADYITAFLKQPLLVTTALMTPEGLTRQADWLWFHSHLQTFCGNTHISSLLFSTPFHIITPNTHSYTDPDNSCLTISSIQSSVTHHNSTLSLPPPLSTSANYKALLRARSKQPMSTSHAHSLCRLTNDRAVKRQRSV